MARAVIADVPMAAFAVSAALVLLLIWMGDYTYTSQSREQRIVTLPDGSRDESRHEGVACWKTQ